MDRIYLDHAATTYVNQEVLQTMLPYFTENFGNASSIHFYGREAKRAVDAARKQVADAIGAKVDEIYFTSGGSESDNWAIRGMAYTRIKQGKHIITTQIEHHAVLHTCAQLEKEGFEVTYLPVDSEGFVNVEELKAAIRPDTTLITVMYANNEIGTVQPIAAIGEIARERGIAFHTDAVQAVGSIDIDVEREKIDLLSLSGHKFYGPKGIGALYIRKGMRPQQFVHGGAQERGKRAGTENLPGIVGLGKAIELATAHLEENGKRLTELREYFFDRLLAEIPEIRINGPRENRLPNNVNISVRYIEGEALLLSLDLKGIAASSGSACTSGSLDPSHVLLAIGLPHEIAHGSLRFSMGNATTKEEVDYTVNALKEITERLRAMSPLFAANEGGLTNV